MFPAACRIYALRKSHKEGGVKFSVGQKVKIMKGDLAGVEGTLTVVENNTYVTLCIEGILTASVRVPKSYLKIIE